ncbi:MAG: gfo/Idh/MocA family oxidoreductase [Verrucomicrobia bacterium]|nr:MAG: gfo/Idh/MocA family oxidoreductase [Verrucomicrobiota bacterium]
MKTSLSLSRISRRQFITTTATAIAAPTIIPASALGANGRPAPSERITMGVVGWGMQGPSNTGSFMRESDCQVVATCNIDKKHLEASVNEINKKYKNQDCKTYHDYREMMARTDIDAVMLAVPDHWHALIATEAARNKKDIYGEKPLARTIAEQQAIVRAVQSNKCIWQTGSWQRSERNFHYAAEIVRNGLIGKVTKVEVGLPSGHHDFAGTGKPLLQKLAQLPEKVDDLAKVVPGTPAWEVAVTQPPPELDYDFWIGPSKMEPYIQARSHMNWRWNYNTGGGQLLDWIGHHCDIGHWGLGNDDTIGPLEVEGSGEFPAKDALWNTCTRYRITCKYPNDITMIIAGGHPDIRDGTKWIGTDGWVWVNRGNAFESSHKEWEDTRSLPEEQRKVRLPFTKGGHWRNFLDSVKTRQPTVTPVEVAHHSALPGHLGLIAMLAGRKIKWDAKNERILDDAETGKWLTRNYRAPWKLG